jgi:hypothetical protein
MVEYHASPKVIPFLEKLGYEIDYVNEKNLFALPTKASGKLHRDMQSICLRFPPRPQIIFPETYHH